MQIHSLPQTQKKINLDICKIYYNSNIIGQSNNPENIFELERVTNSNTKLENRYYKYLGICIDKHFNLNFHIQFICNKLTKALFCLNRVKNVIGRKPLKTLYHALFHSHLLYCNSTLNCANKSSLHHITILQKSHQNQHQC